MERCTTYFHEVPVEVGAWGDWEERRACFVHAHTPPNATSCLPPCPNAPLPAPLRPFCATQNIAVGAEIMLFGKK